MKVKGDLVGKERSNVGNAKLIDQQLGEFKDPWQKVP